MIISAYIDGEFKKWNVSKWNYNEINYFLNRIKEDGYKAKLIKL